MKKDGKLTIHHIFWYFLIFSIAGIIIETIYCYATTGVLESRKGLIWGPFCPVYGVSATILIIYLNRYQNRNILQLFVYGFIIGSIVEYILSFGLESIYGMRFWDYGYVKMNLNGRICLQYSIYWGVLSAIIMKLVKPEIDRLVFKIPAKGRKITEILLIIFFTVNCIFTIWGIQTYENRILKGEINEGQTNNIVINLKQQIENNYFSNERMSKIFPNLRIKDEKGNEIWVRTLINTKPHNTEY